MIPTIAYLAFFVMAMWLVAMIRSRRHARDFTARKTVTFGDESAVRADRIASVLSILAIFLLWGAYTGSSWLPFKIPAAFVGQTGFKYEAVDPSGRTQTVDVKVDVTDVKQPVDGQANIGDHKVAAGRSLMIRTEGNLSKIVSVNGTQIVKGKQVTVADGTVTMVRDTTLMFRPDPGDQIEAVWLPAPEAVVARFMDMVENGYQNTALWQHVLTSLVRVLAGFLLGSLVGIPLGYAMGLSNWFRGWFDPIVEFMRPVPPLALIPLVIIWFGIWETGKVVLLFLAALWLMVIAARAGVSGINLSKIHAAYSLGATRWQILRHVIVPNSMPDLFTGARIALGVCWGTVVAAELVAAQNGVGMMIMVASKFQLTDVVVMGIILIGAIGYLVDAVLRVVEAKMVPWKGKS